MGSSVRNTINLGNSIIGVSILAMPYCFERCGIVLGSLLLLASGLVTRITCHLLLKAAITARRRNYEFLAFHTYGPTGKLVVEIGVLGFLLGSCVAFFVVMGDLAPPLASDLFLLGGGSVLSPQRLRLVTLFLLGTCVGLPLGLLRNLDSLTSLSALSLAFYCLLVLKVFVDSFPVLWSGAWWDRVVLWRHENLLSVLPIFAMALSCQPQLFEIFDTVNEPSLKRMNSVVNGAVQMCSMVYITMGFFGYVAFCGGDAGAPPIPGNVLVRLGSSLWSEFLKLGFVATLVVSFPLCLFPCRTSLHSLLFKRGGKFHDPGYDYIPDGQFRLLTVVLVGATLATACLVPNIEMVLGLTGSTIGTLICVIVPGMVFARVTTKDTNERLLAKFLSWAGLCLMIGCTVTTLSQVRSPPPTSVRAPPGGTRYGQPAAVVVSKPPVALLARADLKVANVSPLPDLAAPPKVSPAATLPPKAPVAPAAAPVEKRLEPVEPVEPVPHEQVVVALKPSPAKPEPPALPPARVLAPVKEPLLDPEALKKEDREIEAATSSSGKKKAAKEDAPQPLPAKGAAPPTVAPQAVESKKQEALLVKIAQEQEVQKKMLEDLQRELKQELAKHKQDVAAPGPANGTLPAAQPATAQGAPAPVVQNIVPAVPPALLPQDEKQEPPKRLDGAVLLPNVPVVGPAAQLQVQQNKQEPRHPVQSADAGLGGSAPHAPQVRVVQQQVQQQQVQQQQVQQQQVRQEQVQHQQVQHQQVQQKQVQQQQVQQQQQVIKAGQGVGSDTLAQGLNVAVPPNHPPPAQPVQGSMLKQPEQQQANPRPQLQLPKAQAAEVFDKSVRNIVKPLNVILQRRDGNSMQVPAVGKFESIQKPQLPEGQAVQPRSADSHRVAEGHHYGEKPVQSVPEAKKGAAPRLVVQRADNRPLVAKMSKDVKREAPAVVPRAAVPKDVPAAQEPVVERKNDPPAGGIHHADPSDSVPVKLEQKDAISPDLPSPARPDVVLAKNEIRRK